MSAKAAINTGADFTASFFPFVTGIWLTSLVFFSLAAFFAAASAGAEKGSRYGNTAVLVFYVIGVVYDILDNGGAVRFFTPFKYFLPDELLEGRVELLFILLCIIVSAAALTLAFRHFEKRDLNAV